MQDRHQSLLATLRLTIKVLINNHVVFTRYLLSVLDTKCK